MPLGQVRTDLQNCLNNFGDEGTDVAVQSDQQLLLAGTSCVGASLIRYNPDGTLDNSFGTGGVVTPGPALTQSHGMALQDDGKIVLAGFLRSGNVSNFMVWHFNSSDGSLDTTFDTDGIAQNDFSAFDEATSVLIQPDGKIVVAGHRCCPPRPTNDFLVSRFLANGAPDTTFGSDSNSSVVIILTTNHDNAWGMA